jgi:hypothetical protein
MLNIVNIYPCEIAQVLLYRCENTKNTISKNTCKCPLREAHPQSVIVPSPETGEIPDLFWPSGRSFTGHDLPGHREQGESFARRISGITLFTVTISYVS